MLHPPEFSRYDNTGNPTDVVNTTQLNELTNLVQMVVNAGVDIVDILLLIVNFRISISYYFYCGTVCVANDNWIVHN